MAEARRKQMMVLPGGTKLIRDQKEGTFEIYDLARDAKEAHNLFDELGDRGPALAGQLEAFFDVHTIERDGYKPPER